MALTLKKINEELKRLGHREQLEVGDGYFYFWSGDTANWLDRTVKVPKVNSLTLEQWIEEYDKLKKLNAEILGGGGQASQKTAPEKVRNAAKTAVRKATKATAKRKKG